MPPIDHLHVCSAQVVIAYNHGLPMLAAPWLSLEALDERQKWIHEQMGQTNARAAKAAKNKYQVCRSWH